MKRCSVLRLFPFNPFRSAPRNSPITRCLRMLAQGTKAAEQGQVIGVNHNAVVKISVGTAHLVGVASGLCSQ